MSVHILKNAHRKRVANAVVACMMSFVMLFYGVPTQAIAEAAGAQGSQAAVQSETASTTVAAGGAGQASANAKAAEGTADQAAKETKAADENVARGGGSEL